MNEENHAAFEEISLKSRGEAGTWPTEATIHEKEKIGAKIDVIANLMNTWGGAWCLVGGLAMELSTKGIYRNHDDVDIVVTNNDLRSFNEFMAQQGYVIEKMEDVYHYFRAASPEEYIEVFPLEHDKDSGRVFLSSDVMHEIAVPLQSLTPDSPFQTVSGQNVPLMPLDGNMYMKLLGGRVKDLFDIARCYDLQTPEENERLKQNWGKTHNRFFVGSDAISDIENLIVKATEVTEVRFKAYYESEFENQTRKITVLLQNLQQKIGAGVPDNELVELLDVDSANKKALLMEIIEVLRAPNNLNPEEVEKSILDSPSIRQFIANSIHHSWQYQKMWEAKE